MSEKDRIDGRAEAKNAHKTVNRRAEGGSDQRRPVREGGNQARPAARSSQGAASAKTRASGGADTVRKRAQSGEAAQVRRVSSGRSVSSARGNTASRPGAKKPPLIRRVFSAIGSGAKKFWHLFDRFRTGPAQSIITNTILAAVLLLLLASIFMLIKPSLDAGSAVSAAKRGDTERALQLMRRAEREGLSATTLDKTRIEAASALTSRGNFAVARQLTDEVRNASLASEQTRAIDYAEANSLVTQGKFDAAAQLYYRLGDYLDSTDRYTDCLCAIAVQAYLDGEESRARSLLAEIDDAENRLPRIFAFLGHEELSSNPLFSVESLENMNESFKQLKLSRQAATRGNIAAGARHSLVLRKDGTVTAAGDDSFGQCRTSQWFGVIQVAAGAFHSVGLCSDGSVVAAGDNSQGQCDVSAWRGIKAIAAGAYFTVGLKEDGSVVACGLNADALSSWRDIQTISAGGYSAAALTSGSVTLCSHAGGLLPMDVKLFDIAIYGPVSAGILYDGSLISTAENAPAWQNLSQVAVSGAGLFAVTQDGALLSKYFVPSEDLGIRISSGASEVAASGGHILVLMNDGRVYAYGDNTYGQTAVNGITR